MKQEIIDQHIQERVYDQFYVPYGDHFSFVAYDYRRYAFLQPEIKIRRAVFRKTDFVNFIHKEVLAAASFSSVIKLERLIIKYNSYFIT